MTAFAIGMLAAFLWLVAIAAVWYMARNSPGPAQWSIVNFRFARRRLAPEDTTSQPQADDGVQWEPASELFPAIATEEPPPLTTGENGVVDEEVREIEEVLKAIAEPKRKTAPTRRPAKPRPKKIGRRQYVLVDDEGKPVFNGE